MNPDLELPAAPPHHCVLSSKDIFKQATEDRLTSAKELPYFEGDFWPNVLEESIKELEQEEEERKKEESTAASETTEVGIPLVPQAEESDCSLVGFCSRVCSTLCGRQ